jgi:hypothetical protein
MTMQMMPKMSWPHRVEGEAIASERMAVDAVVMFSFPKGVFVEPELSVEFTILSSSVEPSQRRNFVAPCVRCGL